jgi:hypothetical protein
MTGAGALRRKKWGLVGIRALKRRLGHYASPKGLITGVRLQILLERCLRAAESEFEQTIEATRASRREHPSLRSGQAPSLRSGQVIGATADLEAVAAEIPEQVKVLDGLVRYRFGDDAELMGAWASARNVLGPFKPKAGDQPKAA